MAAHPDDQAIDNFAGFLKAKMAAGRANGRDGWDDPARCPVELLQSMLMRCVEKGDPVDVGNLAMMLFSRNDPTMAPGGARMPSYADLCNAIERMVSAQHAGPISIEMFDAWSYARVLVDRARGVDHGEVFIKRGENSNESA